MLALKRYFNFAQEALDKTLLENFEVPCSLFDENVHALGYYYAMPVRLMVADRQLQRAARILAYFQSSAVPGDDIAAADDQAPVAVLDEKIFGEDELNQDESSQPGPDNNPWEILAIAYLFLVPGIGFLLEQLPLMLYIGGRRKEHYLVLSPFHLHLVGTALIGIAILLTVSYFHVRRVLARDASASA